MPRVLWLAVILSVCAVAAAAAEYRLTILHTNDFHARFAPVTGSDAPEACRSLNSLWKFERHAGYAAASRGEASPRNRWQRQSNRKTRRQTT